MIPTLIIWLIRRYRHRRDQTQNSKIDLRKQLPRIAGVLLLVIMLFLTVKSHSQNHQFNYQILRNGAKVGTLSFSETSSNGMDYLTMESDVKAQFIFTFTAHAREEAVYNNGVLLHSSIFRKLNGNEKVNKQHQANNQQYVIHEGKSTSVTQNYPITYNMLSLYSKEPENIGKVYSDNFESFLTIQRVDAHKYKVVLPDGNYNYYCYKDGVLNLVEIHHRWYSANIILATN